MEHSRRVLALLAGIFVALSALIALPAKAEGERGKGYQNATVKEDNGIITVCYDLILHHAARVTLSASANGHKLEPNTVTGEVGLVLGPAANICMKWDTLADYPEGLSDYDLALELIVEEYFPPAAEGDAEGGDRKSFSQEDLISCISAKHKDPTLYRSTREELLKYRNDYASLLSNDQAPWLNMMQKLKGGTPFIKRYERDRDGRQIPVYQYEDLSDREKSKLQRELDKQLEKVERNPGASIGAETRRAKERYEASVKRLYSSIASSCERELGMPAANIVEWVEKVLGRAYSVAEPFAFIRDGKDWD